MDLWHSPRMAFYAILITIIDQFHPFIVLFTNWTDNYEMIGSAYLLLDPKEFDSSE